MGKKFLTSKQEELFEKYAIYNEKDVKQKERQKYIYEHLKKNPDKIQGIEKLLDLTVNDMDMQYRRKEYFETKAGFLLAFWGLLLGIFVEGSLFRGIKQCIRGINESANIIWAILFVITVISGLVALFYTIKVLYRQNYKWFAFGDRDNNARVSVEDKELSYITLLEGYTDSWIFNRDQIGKKANFYSKAVICNMIFVVCILISLFY